MQAVLLSATPLDPHEPLKANVEFLSGLIQFGWQLPFGMAVSALLKTCL